MPLRGPWLAGCASLVLVASFTVSTSARADTLFRMTGDSGDWITGGVSRLFTPSQGTFSASVGSGAHLTFTGSGEYWTLDFSGVGRRALAPASYTGAVRAPFASASGNGLEVTGDSRACNQIAGTFVVRQAVYGAGNTLTSFWATFEQHCDDGVTAARGEFRYNADTSLYVTPPADIWVARRQAARFDVSATDTRGNVIQLSVPGLPAGASFTDRGDGTGTFAWNGAPDTLTLPVTFVALSADGHSASGATVLHVHGDDELSMTSDPGDYIGAGQAYQFTPTNAAITASGNGMNAVSLSVMSGDQWWYLDFSAPAGAALQPDTYAGATRYPFNGSGAGLSVYGDGRGCNTLTGSFTVKQVHFGAGSAVSAFWATFEQHCEGMTPALRGEIRVGIDLATPTAMSLVRAEALPGRNRLEWFDAVAVGQSVRVERRSPDRPWLSVGVAVVDAGGTIVFDDTQVESGARLGYRLVYVDGGATVYSAETWLTSAAVTRVALGAPLPNPVRSDFTVVVALPDDSPARLDLLDVAGRSVHSEDPTGLSPGSHAFQVRGVSGLSPGTYWLRLRQGGQAAVRTVVVVR